MIILIFNLFVIKDVLKLLITIVWIDVVQKGIHWNIYTTKHVVIIHH